MCGILSEIAFLHHALGKAFDAAGDDSKTRCPVVLFAVLEDDLGPKADTQEGRPRFVNLADTPGKAFLLDIPHGLPGCAYPREDDAIGTAQLFGAIRDDAGNIQILKGAGNACEVSRSIVYNGNHRSPAFMR